MKYSKNLDPQTQLFGKTLTVLNNTWIWNGKTWTRVLDPKPVNSFNPYLSMTSTTNPLKD